MVMSAPRVSNPVAGHLTTSVILQIIDWRGGSREPTVDLLADNEKDCIRSAQSAGHRKRPTHRDLVG
jgi:hypothetical protein